MECNEIKTQKPNILLFLTDQQRLSALGCYGPTVCQTPNIDRIAAQGVRFETAYTTTPVCTPARATVMTGMYPHQHGFCCNAEDLQSGMHELRDRPGLLSRRLIEAGYSCGYTGKWHLGSGWKKMFGYENHPALPQDVGFVGQNFHGHGGGGFKLQEYQDYLSRNGWKHTVLPRHEGKRYPAEYGITEGPVESTVPYFLAEHTIGLIKNAIEEKKPFFIWHNEWGPHHPYYVPQEYYDLYKDLEIPPWPNFEFDALKDAMPHAMQRKEPAESFTWDDWAEAIRYYYAFTTLIDHQIGRVLDFLSETGLDKNTVTVFSSDHGDTIGSHGGMEDKGRCTFEEVQRIGMLFRLPEHHDRSPLPAGTVLKEWASLADLYPTFCDIAGAEYDKNEVKGRSLWPLLNGDKPAWRDRILIETNGLLGVAHTMFTIRHQHYKFSAGASGQCELYDLQSDPHEMRNLSRLPDMQPVVDQMKAILIDELKATDYPGTTAYSVIKKCR
jgi:arylsulfatase A-like enzyme